MNEVINRIGNIFKERYETQLQIQWTGKSEKAPVFLSHWKTSFVYSRSLKQVSFPLFNSKKELQAVAVASPVENKDAVVFGEMANFLQLTIAEHLEIQERENALTRAEAAHQMAHGENENIIPFKSKNPKALERGIRLKPIKPKRPASNQPIWIWGTDASTRNHVAFSIHDWMSNWAFINAHEIPDLIWQDPDHWKSFPQITIFIPDVDKLDEAKIETLKSNLKTLKKTTGKTPMVVVSSEEEPGEEMRELLMHFKTFRSNKNVSPRAQAHFLLFHHQDQKPWTYRDKKDGGVFFLPFGPTPSQFH